MSTNTALNSTAGISMVYVCVVLAAAVMVLGIISLLNFRKIAALNDRYNEFFRRKNMSGATLEDLLLDCLSEIRELSDSNQSLTKRLSAVESQLSGCFQKIGVVRYNPFEDTGGDLSYAIALLDETNSGFIINGIYSRAGSYTYAKEIEHGVSERHKLSPEELEALQIAVKRTVDYRHE